MSVENASTIENQAAQNTSLSDEMTPNMVITPSAQEYLNELLGKQNTPGIGVRIFVEHPGTARAECCMAYSTPEEVNTLDYHRPKIAPS